MYQVPYLRVRDKLDPYTQIPRMIPAHEIAIYALRRKETRGKIDIDGIADIEKYGVYTVDSLQEEHARLEKLHGNHPKSEIPWATMAFGHPEEGRLEMTLKAAAEKYADEMVSHETDSQPKSEKSDATEEKGGKNASRAAG